MRSEMAIGMTAGGLTGAGLLIAGIYQRNRVATSQSWPQTSATVTGGSIVTETSNDSTGYSVSLNYEYFANGVKYTGKRIGFTRRVFSRRHRAHAELERYPVDAVVTVYFNPAKPSEAVLVRSAPDSIVLIVMGIVLLGIIVAGLVWGFLNPAG